MGAPYARTKGERAKKPLTLINFGGVNIQARRQAINDDEFAWLENAMPVGAGNLKIVPAQSAALTTWASQTVASTGSANISGSDYIFGFSTTGAAVQVNLTNGLYTQTVVGANGTFSNSGVQMTQWKNAGILIIDPVKGLFDWNVTTANTLTAISNTVTALTITAIGINYTSQPTIGFSGGGGASAAATADIQMGLATVTAAGTGYQVGDVLTVSGGTLGSAGSGTAASIKVTSVGGSNAITGISLVNTGDYTASPANPVSVTGGYGTGATFTLNFGIGPVKITNSGTGYTSAPAISVTSGGGTGGAITAVVSGSLAGTAIATYAGRVWIANGRVISFSDVASYNNFATGASGNLTITDSTLHNAVTALFVANNFLYILGDTSIDVLGDVRVVSGVTSFTRTNVTASIGTNLGYSVFPFYRGLFFANPIGFYALIGATPEKISDKIDTLIPQIMLGSAITGGQVSIFNTLCAAFLFRFADIFTPTGGTRPLIGLFFNKKWYFSSQGALTVMTSVPIKATPTLFGWDTNNLYQLFSNTTSTIASRIQTKLYDGGEPLLDKQVLKAGLGVTYVNTVVESDNITIDNEFRSSTPAFIGSNQIIFTTNAGKPVTFTNSASIVINWTVAGYLLTKSDVDLNGGKYIGMTITSNSPGLIVNEALISYEEGASW